jgi:hypothetical protein
MKDNLFDTKSAVAPPVRVVIDGIDPDSPQAQALLANNADVITQFIATQRRDYARNILNIHKAYTRTPDIGISYQNQFGHETVRLTPYPVYPSETSSVSAQPAVPQPESIQPPSSPPLPPPPSLYLMVLYKFNGQSNGIAAIDMSTLSSTGVSPFYQSTSQGSNWGATQVPVAQYNFGRGGVILAPINFTPNAPAATKLYLSTTVLKSQQTLLEAAHKPIMNGSGNTIYTALESWTLQNGILANNGPVDISDMVPYFISPDGDYYYAPAWNGPQISLGLGGSYPSYNNGSPPASNMTHFYGADTELASLISTQLTDLPTAQSYNFPALSDGWSMTISPDTASGLPGVNITMVVQNYVGTAAGEVSSAAVGADGYVGQASNGASVSLLTMSIAYVAQWYQTLTGTWSSGDGSSNFSGDLPYPLYTIPSASSSSDTVVASMEYILGDYAAAIGAPSAEVGIPPSLVITFTSAPDPYPGNTGQLDYYLAYGGATPAVEATYHTGFNNIGPLSGNLDNSIDHVFYPVSVTNTALVTPSTITSTYFGLPVSDSSINDWALAQLPSIPLGEPGPLAGSTTLAAFGEQWTESVTSAEQTAIFVESFPPSLSNGTYYYSTLVGTETYTTMTPYGAFNGTSMTSFFPWLHVSNGVHYLQGFTMDGVPHLYLDGQPFLSVLASSLGSDVQPSDIYAVFADIPIDAIQSLTNVSIALPTS